jgi:hypothetical protein
MCSYQGKLKPSLAHHIIDTFTGPGDVVIDPFSGAGTIPFEACRMRRQGIGIDISRLGYVLTWAKVARSSKSKIETRLMELDRHLAGYAPEEREVANAAQVRFNGAIPDFFHPQTLREVLGARQYFLANWGADPEWAILFACVLHLLHGNRPYALSRRSHPVTPFKPTGEFEYRPLMPRLRAKLEMVKTADGQIGRSYGHAFQADATASWPTELPLADAIITSPPFFNSTRFYMANWMRFWFSGWEKSDFDVQPKIFLESRQTSNLDAYLPVFESAHGRLKKSGVFVLHLGLSAKCDMAAELKERAKRWFDIRDIFIEDVAHCESHGIRDKGTVEGHSYLVLTPR